MSVFAEDTFTDTDGTLLADHTPTGTVPGTSWINSFLGGALTITSNRVRSSGSAESENGRLLEKATAYADDYKVQADFVFVAQADDLVFITARQSTTDFTCYRFGYDAFNHQWLLQRIAAGGASTDLATPVAFAWPGDGQVRVLRLEANGTSVKCYVDDALTFDVTDANVTAGRPGVDILTTLAGSGTAGLAIDNFSVSDFATSAALTGTATASITEADIVAGGKTIILTLTGDTFIPA